MVVEFSLHRLRQALHTANERLIGRGTAGVVELLLVAIAIVALGIGVSLASGGYHGGFHFLHHISQAALPEEAWEWLTWFGDGRVLLVVSLLFVRRRPEIFWAMIVGAVIGGLYARGMKVWFDELRPPAVLSPAEIHLIGSALSRHSFPSGHTLTVFLFAGVLFAHVDAWRWRVLLLAVAAMVGVSRVALGVHWPQDVIAGAFSGLMIAALAVWITRYWRIGLRPGIHVWLLTLPAAALVLVLFDHQGNPWEPELIIPMVVIGVLVLVTNYRDLFELQRGSRAD